MRYAAVTTYAPKHWKGHARRMVESFGQHWDGVPLLAFDDDALAAAAPGLQAFKARYPQSRFHGRVAGSYDMRFDAVRFSHKVYAIAVAAERVDADVLIWIDADTVTHAPVTADWLDGLIGDADIACLLRSQKYTECGFVMYRLNVLGREFIRRFVGLYDSGALFQLAEWHDSFAFDHVRQAMEAEGLTVADLSGEASGRGHPFVNCDLGSRMDHCKGNRKRFGRSHRGDLMAPRSEPYWSTGTR